MREVFITYLIVCLICHVALWYLLMEENDENE